MVQSALDRAPGEGALIVFGALRPPRASALRCPLCGVEDAEEHLRQGGRRFLRCPTCDLLFLDPVQRLGPADERARYQTHENHPEDPRYRAFLRRLADPLLERLAPGSVGLDYGSGPGPTLSRILTEAGHPTRDYDPFFTADPSVLDREYDFVTCSETAEHFFDPAGEFRRIDGLIAPGGWFGLMTGIVRPGLDLASWWYLRDPTHVAFYSPAALKWIARDRSWSVQLESENVT
ncbi:MAG: class I SAM-dependent methyltransferase, partial [Gemmatimonadota bacterium]